MTSYGSIWKHLVFFSPVPKFFFILSAIRTSWKKFAHDRTHWHEDRNYLVKQSATIKGCILNASQRRKKMITLHVFSRRFHLFYVIAIRYSTECIFFSTINNVRMRSKIGPKPWELIHKTIVKLFWVLFLLLLCTHGIVDWHLFWAKSTLELNCFAVWFMFEITSHTHTHNDKDMSHVSEIALEMQLLQSLNRFVREHLLLFFSAVIL